MKQITDIHCSSLARPMTCMGSLFFDLPRQPTNAAAEEGTAAGEYLQHLLEDTVAPTTAKNGVFFDNDMKFYAESIAKEIFNKKPNTILCEQKIDWQTRSGIWIKGKYDSSFVSEGDLYIDDLKYGWNIVDVHQNWQLIGYAIGEILRRNEYFKTIIMRIHQPRPHHEAGSTREWKISYEELIDYKEQIEKRCEQISSGMSELVTSPKCKYCAAAPSACTAFNRSFYSSVDYVLHHIFQDDINEKEVAFQLDLLSRVNDVLKIKTDSLHQLAIDRIKQGKVIPDYAFENSYGNREWKIEVSPEVMEMLTGIKVTEQTMLSPAKCEKLGISKDLIASFTNRQFRGQKLKYSNHNKLGVKIFGKQG